MSCKSSQSLVNDFLKKLGNNIPYDVICENKRITEDINKKQSDSKGDVDVYSFIKKHDRSPVGTLIIRNDVKNNQVVVGIGSNPRKVVANDPTLNTITKLEQTRLNILHANIKDKKSIPAKYLLQFDLSTYASEGNKEFNSFLKKESNMAVFQQSVQDAYDATKFFLDRLKSLRNEPGNKLNLEYIVLSYGSEGRVILNQNVKLNTGFTLKKAYYDLFLEYYEDDRVKQFVVEKYPPHSSSTQGAHGILDNALYFDDYFN